MQKIETWRIKELSLVLQQMTELLKQGNNREWANVFSHFRIESQNIVDKKEFDAAQLERLVRNIKNCFHNTSTLRNLELSKEGSLPDLNINQELLQTKAYLLKILDDMKERMVEHIH
jgi:hypothetical protein